MPIISRLKNAKKITSGNFKGWKGTFEKNINVQLFCTGIGTKKIDLPIVGNESILNIGIAGALSKKFGIGDWIEISKVNNFTCNIFGKFNTAKLISVNAPVLNENEAQKLDADLVDMEGLAVANFAAEKNLPCNILKMVSDCANENSADDFKKSMKLYINSCFEKLHYLING